MRGHIRKRGSKWCVVLFLGYDEKGKKKYKWHSGFNTKKEAEKFLAAKVQEVHAGLYTEPSKDTFAAFLDKWLDDKKSRVRLRTYEIYERTIRLHVKPHLGHIELGKLKPQHLREFYAKLQSGDKPLSNRYVSQIHTMIHDALETAVSWEYLPRNVADMVKAPKPEQKKFSVWTLEEVQRFLEVARHDRFYIAYLLAITTGMRQGEILALRWSDIDLPNGRLFVQRTTTQVRGTIEFGDPKSDSGKRMIALPHEVIGDLLKHKKDQDREKELMGDAYRDQDLVVARKNGDVVAQSLLREHFTKLIQKADLPYIRFHDLRHTHASLLLQQGVHPKIVSERLGHSKISITLDTYSHVLPGLQEQVAKDFGNALFGNRNALPK
ncbi:site-specific integrase [Effusibacillus pohliae]|uniref:site-specific integrase n=1 Tax=Effusibacillus pohliae TaxID=232270 RepID=UPI0003738B1E|nr:site-specific integrase [Effusibacillus pohliae]